MTTHPSFRGARSARSYLPVFLGLMLAAAVLPGIVAAQAPPTVNDSIFQMRVGDGSRTYGRVVEVTEEHIVFETVAGVRMQANRAFARLEPARGRVVDGEFWPEDRHTTRLFFAPTGRTLRGGEGYAGVFFILPFVGYGVSDNLTLAGGMPLIGSLESVPVWIAPKLRVYTTPTAQISTGVFAINIPDWESEYDYSTGSRRERGRMLGIVYGVGTFGDMDNALHAGTGVTFGTDGTEVPVMVGGELRMSRRHKFVTENWLLPTGGTGMLSGGVRFMGERWTTDLGLMTVLGNGAESEIPYFPIVSFSYAFGGR